MKHGFQDIFIHQPECHAPMFIKEVVLNIARQHKEGPLCAVFRGKWLNLKKETLWDS